MVSRRSTAWGKGPGCTPHLSPRAPQGSKHPDKRDPSNICHHRKEWTPGLASALSFPSRWSCSVPDCATPTPGIMQAGTTKMEEGQTRASTHADEGGPPFPAREEGSPCRSPTTGWSGQPHTLMHFQSGAFSTLVSIQGDDVCSTFVLRSHLEHPCHSEERRLLSEHGLPSVRCPGPW